jgi:PAS domain S-box-containing protein
MIPSDMIANAPAGHRSGLSRHAAQAQRYGFAVLSVGIAVGASLVLDRFGFRSPHVVLLLLAVALNAWYVDRGPALLSLVLALVSMAYFFVAPRFTFFLASSDLPYYLNFVALSTLILWFSTVRRRIENDLRQARDTLKLEVDERSSLLDLTHDSITVRSMDFVLTYWNRGAEEFYGWRQNEAVGRRSDELLNTVFPQPVEQIQAELLEKDRWEGELTRTRADGSLAMVSSRWALRRDHQDRPVAILETSNDITVRRRREQEIQRLNRELAKQVRLLDQTHDSIIFRDLDGRITYWNRGAQELYGWTAAQAIGRTSHELLRTIFPAPLPDLDVELLRAGVWEGELRHVKSDGTELVVASRWSLARDENGQPTVMETNNDLTERKRREDEVRQLNQELARRAAQLDSSNKELEAFAYSVSHDLRAPLRHMAGFAELLQKNAATSLNAASQRYLTMILEAAARMGSLIDDLLAFSRIGRAESHESLVDLNQIVEDVVSEVRRDARGRNIAWKTDSLPACHGDRPMLRLAFLNLISNALKFSRTRPQAEIEIGCTNRDGADPVLFVRDNGVGFDMKYSNKLFGVFQRLHPQEAFEGTGIGLATVQRIVQRHGGRVWAEGTVDGGATFYVSLPKIARS